VDCSTFKDEGITVLQNVGVHTVRNIFTFQNTRILSNSTVRTTNIADYMMCGGRVPLHFSYSCQAIFHNTKLCNVTASM